MSPVDGQRVRALRSLLGEGIEDGDRHLVHSATALLEPLQAPRPATAPIVGGIVGIAILLVAGRALGLLPTAGGGDGVHAQADGVSVEAYSDEGELRVVVAGQPVTLDSVRLSDALTVLQVLCPPQVGLGGSVVLVGNAVSGGARATVDGVGSGVITAGSDGSFVFVSPRPPTSGAAWTVQAADGSTVVGRVASWGVRLPDAAQSAPTTAASCRLVIATTKGGSFG
jgi:hypothetical protein